MWQFIAARPAIESDSSARDCVTGREPASSILPRVSRSIAGIVASQPHSPRVTHREPRLWGESSIVDVHHCSPALPIRGGVEIADSGAVRVCTL
jgi:hypothetical protein